MSGGKDAPIKLVINERITWPNRINSRRFWSLEVAELTMLIAAVSEYSEHDDRPALVELLQKLFEAYNCLRGTEAYPASQGFINRLKAGEYGGP